LSRATGQAASSLSRPVFACVTFHGSNIPTTITVGRLANIKFGEELGLLLALTMRVSKL